MMLSYQTILNKISRRDITIVPCKSQYIGPASYDLTLGNSFTEIIPDIDLYGNKRAASLKEEYTKLNNITLGKDCDYIIGPKKFVLATTLEYLKVPNDIAIYVEGRSSIGRLGLQVQNAGFVDPGFEGQITLELFNASDIPISLEPGRRICQITFIKLDEGTIKPYNGKYNKQTGATPSRIYKDFEV